MLYPISTSSSTCPVSSYPVLNNRALKIIAIVLAVVFAMTFIVLKYSQAILPAISSLRMSAIILFSILLTLVIFAPLALQLKRLLHTKISSSVVKKENSFSFYELKQILSSYAIQSTYPRKRISKFSEKVVLIHYDLKTIISIYREHPLDSFSTQTKSALVLSLHASMEKEGNNRRTHSCSQAIPNALWDSLKKQGKRHLIPGELRLSPWENSYSTPSKPTFLGWILDSFSEKIIEEHNLQEIYLEMFQQYQKIISLCLENQITEIHLPFLGDTSIISPLLDESKWQAASFLALLKTLSYSRQKMKCHTKVEIVLDNQKTLPALKVLEHFF